jgi:hypothetical protein
MLNTLRTATLFLLVPVAALAVTPATSTRDTSTPDSAPTKKPQEKPKAERAPRVHSVALGGTRKVPYSQEGDPEGARPGETELEVRPLVVDGRVKDWTTGERHDVTEHTFVVRSALRINDSLPQDKSEHWVWQRGPWLLIDRTSGHSEPLKLPDFASGVSEIAWFRDYAAYCGVPTSGKHLYAVVAQIAVRKPLLARKLGPWDEGAPHAAAACAPATWQREPLQVTFQPNGLAPSVFDLTAASPEPAEASTPATPAAALPSKSR